jgi:hypothetical protein
MLLFIDTGLERKSVIVIRVVLRLYNVLSLLAS